MTAEHDYKDAMREIRELRDERDRLRDELRFAKLEFECQRNWLDRAVTSNYQYNNDPALPGHRNAVANAATRIGGVLEQLTTPKEER